jgi:hypothetical protein
MNNVKNCVNKRKQNSRTVSIFVKILSVFMLLLVAAI